MGKQKIGIGFVLGLVCMSYNLALQAQDFKFIDSVYVDNIKSVKFHVAGNPLALPVIPLRSDVPLELSFDDMETNTKDYTVTIIHCNKNWMPSEQINELEYLTGYNNAPIRNFSLSFNTFVRYTHYSISLPNYEVGWKLSGNYLLKVVDNDNDDKIVITRRFIVFEPLMKLAPTVTRTAEVSKSTTHQELDFELQYPDFKIRSPRTELSATVMMNNRWDSAIQDINPVFIHNESAIFDHQDKVVFEAGKEFRFFDMRGLNILGENVQAVRRIPEGFEVDLRKELINTNATYLFRKDINGNFVIDCYDVDVSECDTKGDYAYVFFTLSSPEELEGKSIYITGAISDWQLKPEFKMHYNESKGVYEAEVMLKQGYYNYQFTTFDEATKKRDDSYLQGNWFETENTFTIIVYYRGFSDRYDRPVAFGIFDSRKY